MNRITFFLAGLLLGGFSVFLSLKYHVVRAEDGFHFVPKAEASFEDVYADIRHFSFNDWQEHQSLASALAKADKADLMRGSAGGMIRNTVDGFLPARNP